MRITLALGLAACAGLVSLTAPAAALPAAGLGQYAKAPTANPVETVEFKRYPDGSVYWTRAHPNGRKTYYFAYRGYAYPYNPGYTYRLFRGRLKPNDRPHRYKIAD